jgi:pilus assembly protein Flp/PilA
VDIVRSIHMRLYLALGTLRDREDGQAMVEYALILFLVSVVSIAVLTQLGQSVSSVFSKINADL